MDDELKRRIAASLDGPKDGPADPTVVAELDRNPEAREFVKGLYAIDHALKTWPKTKDLDGRDAAAWEKFAQSLEKRLGEAPWESATNQSGYDKNFDPLKPPVFSDDEEQAKVAAPRERTSKQQVNKTEKKSMAQSQDDNNDDDLEGLAALTRTSAVAGSVSIPPPPVRPGPALVDDKMDESSGVVDIKELAELALKQPPAPSLESLREGASTESKASATAGSKTTTEAGKGKTESTASTSSGASAKAAAPVRSLAEAREAKEKRPTNTVALVAFTAIAAAAVSGIAVSQFNKGSGANQASSAQAVSVESSADEQANRGSSATTEGRAERVTVQERELARAPVVTSPSLTATPALEQQAQQGQPGQPIEGPAVDGSGAAIGGNSAPTVVAAADPQVPQPTAPPAAIAPTQPVQQQLFAANSGTNQGPAHPESTAVQQPPAPARVAVADHRPAVTDSHSENDQSQNSRAPRTQTVAARDQATPSPTPSPTPTANPTTAVALRAQPRLAATQPTPAVTTPATTPATPTGNSLVDRARSALGPGQGPSTPQSLVTPTTPRTTTPTTPANLPERPTSSQVSSAMSPLAGQVRACTQGQLGTATVALQIANSGSVVNASVSGFSPSINACIQGVVRRAHFPPFTRPVVSIVYPFRILPPQ